MRGFRAQIVGTTVLLVAGVMLAVVVGTQVALELSEGRARTQTWDILAATGIVGACGVALSGFVAWRVSHRVLAPVRQMAERAEEWSAHDLAHRFELGSPSNELTQLGATLNHLLDRVARAIRDEQRLTAELAHEIRTPLTAIRGSAELALLRSPADPEVRTDLTEIAAGCQRLADVVTALLDLAQATEGLHGVAVPDDVVAQLSGLVREPVVLSVTGSAPSIAGPASLVARALAPLLENAALHARSQVAVELRNRDLVEVAVSDDGPGVAPDVRESIFEPGVSTQGTHGLGLGIARRVARSLGGDVELQGDAFVLRLPRA